MGAIHFHVDNDDGERKEVMRIEEDGKFYVNGILVESSIAEGREYVYEQLRDWLNKSRH
jgi:hypothetical protein